VINLRGRVLPGVKLAAHLALGVTERARSARVVVVDGGAESIGLRVDGVSEVLRVSAADMEPRSAKATRDTLTAVLGVAKLGERLVLLLDLDAVVGGLAVALAQTQLEAH
jgi:purine-binding chemotaxis protein CheW